jgi:cobalt/nickel transport system permease protein
MTGGFGVIAMHIPDGFLSVPVSVILWLISAGVVAYALVRVREDLGERQVPLMGVVAAAIFAGQMLNFPVAGGTSGHLVGAAIASIILGPWAALLVMTSVVSIQALLFQDGGLLALGGNIFNMGVLSVAVAYGVYALIRRAARRQRWGLMAGAFAAGWASVFVSSLAVAIQLAVSGASTASLAVPAMAGIHAVIGFGEGLITMGAVVFLLAGRPDLVKAGAERTTSGAVMAGVGLLLALVLAVLSPWASSHPDGLESVAGDLGFLSHEQSAPFDIFAGYSIPGISDPVVATVLAGVVGTLIVFGVALAVGYARRKRTGAAH